MIFPKCCKELPLIPVFLVLLLIGIFLFQNYPKLFTSKPKWVTFSGSKVEYSINYPEGWKVVENYIGNDFLAYFAISNGTYKLKYYPPSALKGICIFNDTNTAALKKELDKYQPGYYDQANIRLGEYTQFGNYRRSVYKGEVIVCKGTQETGFKYILPQAPDKEIISLMDKMVQSFHWGG